MQPEVIAGSGYWQVWLWTWDATQQCTDQSNNRLNLSKCNPHDKDNYIVGILKLREELRITKTYEKWIKQEGTDLPPVCDDSRKKQESGMDSNKLTYQNLKG